MRTGRFVDTDRILPAIYGRDSHCVFKTLPRLPLNSIRGEADLGRLFENDIMISFFVIRGTRRGIPFALGAALSLLGNVSALAQQSSDKTLPPVVVSSTRFENNVEPGPIGATIITAEQIREAGVNNDTAAIRKIAGEYGRQKLNGTQDSALDLRGFGDDSRQNLVVLVDGIRLSENELANPLLSSVPIELVERIEIIRGGSSVLYGEGATAGVINVITKRAKPNAQGGSLVGEAGSYAHRELRASAAKSWESLALDANIGELRTDNYRANNALRQRYRPLYLVCRPQARRLRIRCRAVAALQDGKGSLRLIQRLRFEGGQPGHAILSAPSSCFHARRLGQRLGRWHRSRALVAHDCQRLCGRSQLASQCLPEFARAVCAG